MNVSLTRELEALVNAKVKTGMYQTASEVIREGLRLLKERDEAHERLKADVLAGFAEIEKGNYVEYDATTTKQLVKEIGARGRLQLKKERSKTAHR
ncbi:MAG TPA: type II toxin-antitoxin system ParD family antitoxin [Bryobacteraceae bacterium]|jgi:antitoxin ParD1/3/4|nr:type II toxin-antitoxin system ParD family antitoxin [Bryobacteraceae bacterium]